MLGYSNAVLQHGEQLQHAAALVALQRLSLDCVHGIA
jgi:hypothetical protein